MNLKAIPVEAPQIQVSIPEGASLNDSVNTFAHPVLNELLELIEKVDFRQEMGLEEDEKPKQKHFVVLMVEKLLEAARRNDFGLALQNDFIYIFDSVRWAVLDRNEFKFFLGKAAQKMGYSVLECKHYTFRNELYQQFLSEGYVPPPEPPQDVVLVNVQNGTLEISPQGFRLRPHQREDFLRYVLPFEYRPQADCAKFKAFLDRVQPDKPTQRVLSEYFGYVFTRHLKLEKMLVLYGSGANGKSVFFDIMNALLGRENITNFSLKNLDQEHNRALIVNALLNYGSEIRGKIDKDILKTLASGEPMQARLLYHNSFTADNYAKLAFNANELPAEVEHNEAYFRRFLIVPFDVTIPEDERNPNLAREIIAEELPGVLNWVLEGLNRLLQQHKFTHSEKVQQALAEYRTSSDSVALFLDEEGYRPSITEEQTRKALLSEYRNYCIDNGYRPCSDKSFGKRLKALGYEQDKKNIGKVVFIEKVT